MPFRMHSLHLEGSYVGFATSLYFMAMTAMGFALKYVRKWLNTRTFIVCIGMMLFGLVLNTLFDHILIFLLCTVLLGTGYGIIQPILLD